MEQILLYAAEIFWLFWLLGLILVLLFFIPPGNPVLQYGIFR